jgi:cysteinyl-tRNA synthetase
MSLRFYNSLSKIVEKFESMDGETVRMYTCGPTVYDYAHIGNLKTFMFQDILRRWLRYRGYELNHVMNITDVEDKIIRNALAKGMTINEFTRPFEVAFLEDIAKLRIEQPERIVRATEHIDGMVKAIQTLGEKGLTYESDGSTYYRIGGFPTYGRLSNIDVKGQKAGARVDVDEYEKDDARDFVLWKARKGEEPFWDSPLGEGRPGWHIECSAMSMEYLGETLDIHTGGVDLRFPHHENEIAQSEGVTGKQFVRFWMHSEHLMVEGQKMAKSAGNFYTLRDILEQGHQPETVRYLLAAVPYRNKFNFTFDGLKGAVTAIERLRNFKLRLETDRYPDGLNEELAKRTAESQQRFEEAMDDDLNTSEALAAVFEFVRDGNTAMDSGKFRTENAAPALDVLQRFDSVFDVLKPAQEEGGLSDAEVDALIAERTAARKAKNFARADEIRDQLSSGGIVLEDTREGIRWKRK